jgi:hypothetical protein
MAAAAPPASVIALTTLGIGYATGVIDDDFEAVRRELSGDGGADAEIR